MKYNKMEEENFLQPTLSLSLSVEQLQQLQVSNSEELDSSRPCSSLSNSGRNSMDRFSAVASPLGEMQPNNWGSFEKAQWYDVQCDIVPHCHMAPHPLYTYIHSLHSSS